MAMHPNRLALGALFVASAALTALGCNSQEPREQSPVPTETRVGETAQGLTCLTIVRGFGGGVEDAHLVADPTDPSKASTNYGVATQLNTGQFGTGQRRAILRFDLSSIPSSAVVTSATLNLQKSSGIGSGNIDVHRVTAPWTESTVTYNAIGGAWDPSVVASFDPAAIANGSPVSVDLTSLANSWVTGALPNDGILLEQPPTGRTVFGSSEASVPNPRPKLSVCFAPASCNDGIQNGSESGVDCGGPCAPCNACVGVVCAPLDACHVAGVCNPGTGLCSNPAATNGTPCDDSNACTQSDACQAGTCTGASPVVCSASDACHAAGLCDPQTGACSNPPVADGTSCDDGNTCTQPDSCQAGICTGSAPAEACGNGLDDDCDGQVDEGCQGSGLYATAMHSSGTEALAFVWAPAGTTFANDADYVAYCNSQGFDQNQNSHSIYSSDGSGMYNTTDYYCANYCCYLGAGNSQASNLSNFQNHGLPVGANLQVLDRGCGHYCGSFDKGMNTTDTLLVSGASSFTYQANALGTQNYCQSKSVAFAQDGVVICQISTQCVDGIQNGDETGIDCGGSICGPCGNMCGDGLHNGDEMGVDCGGAYCPVCPTCSDGIQNQDETGVDCGGSTCAACPNCSDGIQNQDETGVDCGGSTCGACPTCSDGIQNQDETWIDCGGSTCAPCGDLCGDGIQNGDETGVDCGGVYCAACQGGLYATAMHSSGTEALAFVWAPAGTTFASDADYVAYCNSHGFDQNQNSHSIYSSDGSGMYNTTDYYCANYCCYLGAGNSQANNLSNFQNHSLPVGTSLQVLDRGCGHYCGSFDKGMNTTDTLVVSGSSSFTYQANALGTQNYCQSKSVSFAQDGVVICQISTQCVDGIQNGDETGVDCGGSICGPCGNLCGDGFQNGDETGIDCGGSYCATCGDMCGDGLQNGDETGVDCGGSFCAPCQGGLYATAMHSSGTKMLAFVYAPPGTTFTSDAEYAAFCNSQGFTQNQNSHSIYSSDGSGMYSTSAYYCANYCCYLGAGNSQANSLSGFQNFGLPVGASLQVLDRGCGHYCGSFNSGMNTTDTLLVSGPSSFTYQANALGTQNYCQSKTVTVAQGGVVVCQTN